MDQRMVSLLRSLLLNVTIINDELQRLYRTEQFTPTPECRDLCEAVRECYLEGMEKLQNIEKQVK